MTYWHGGREITIEISSTKTAPGARSSPTYWTATARALLGCLGRGAGRGPRAGHLEPGGQPLDATGRGRRPRHRSRQLLRHAPTPTSATTTGMLLPGTYTLRYHRLRPRDRPSSPTWSCRRARATRLDAVLEPVAYCRSSAGDVTDQPRRRSPGPRSRSLGPGLRRPPPAADGAYGFASVFTGDYTFRVAAAGFETVEATAHGLRRPHRSSTSPSPRSRSPSRPTSRPTNGGLVATHARAGSGGRRRAAATPARTAAARCGRPTWPATTAPTPTGTSTSPPRCRSRRRPASASGTGTSSRAARLRRRQRQRRPTNGGSTTVVTPDGGYPSSDITALGQTRLHRPPPAAGSRRPSTSRLGRPDGQAALALRLRLLGRRARLVRRRHHSSPGSPTPPTSSGRRRTPRRRAGRLHRPVERPGSRPGCGPSATAAAPPPTTRPTPPRGRDLPGHPRGDPGGRRNAVAHPYLEVGQGSLIFGDGFDSGDTAAWSAVLP